MSNSIFNTLYIICLVVLCYVTTGGILGTIGALFLIVVLEVICAYVGTKILISNFGNPDGQSSEQNLLELLNKVTEIYIMMYSILFIVPAVVLLTIYFLRSKGGGSTNQVTTQVGGTLKKLLKGLRKTR